MDTNALSHLVARMAKIREEYGEEAWLEAMKQFGKDCIMEGGQAEKFAKIVFEDEELRAKGLDWGALKREVAEEAAPATPMDNGLFMKALQQQLPGLKSQAQFTAFQAAFEAFRATVNGILGQNQAAEAAGKEALGKGFEAVRVATTITRKLEDVPEAVSSKAGEEFKRPPSEFGEYDVQRRLLSEVERIQTLGELTDWWASNRAAIDTVKSPTLRNPLIDAVRDKKAKLGQEGQA